jgi:hypothetical protein
VTGVDAGLRGRPQVAVRCRRRRILFGAALGTEERGRGRRRRLGVGDGAPGAVTRMQGRADAVDDGISEAISGCTCRSDEQQQMRTRACVWSQARCHGGQARSKEATKTQRELDQKNGENSAGSPRGREHALRSRRRTGASGFRRNPHRNATVGGGRWCPRWRFFSEEKAEEKRGSDLEMREDGGGEEWRGD